MFWILLTNPTALSFQKQEIEISKFSPSPVWQGGVSQLSAAYQYQPPIPRSLLGYGQLRTLQGSLHITALNKTTSGDFLTTLTIRLNPSILEQVKGRSGLNMKISNYEDFRGSSWQPFTNIITNWQLSSKALFRPTNLHKQAVVYAVIKAEISTTKENASPANRKRSFYITPILHDSIDVSAPQVKLERIENGFIDWTHSRIFLESKSPVLPSFENKRAENSSSKTQETESSSLIYRLGLAEQALIEKLQSKVFKAITQIPLKPNFSVNEALFLNPSLQNSLLYYTSLLQSHSDMAGYQAPLSLLSVEYNNVEIQGNDTKAKLRLTNAFNNFSTAPFKEGFIQERPENVVLLSSPHSKLHVQQVLEPYTSASNNKGIQAVLLHEFRIISMPLALQIGNSSEKKTFYQLLQNLAAKQLAASAFPKYNKNRLAASKPFSDRFYKAFVIDTRGLNFSPHLFPKIVSEKGYSIIDGTQYSTLLAQTKNPASGNPTSWRKGIGSSENLTTKNSPSLQAAGPTQAYLRYVRSLENIELPKETLFVQAKEIDRQAIVLDDFYAEIMLASVENRNQLATSALWILSD